MKTFLAIAIVKYIEGEIDIFRVLMVNTALHDDMVRAEEPTLYAAATRLAYLHQQIRNGMRDLLPGKKIRGLMGNTLEKLTAEEQGTHVYSKELYQPPSNR